MKACKHPCRECPFKKESARGWLGGFSAEETLNVARSESSFQCHMTRESGNEKECTGRLLFAKNICKSFRNKDLDNLKQQVLKDNSTDDILGYMQFLEHHNI